MSVCPSGFGENAIFTAPNWVRASLLMDVFILVLSSKERMVLYFRRLTIPCTFWRIYNIYFTQPLKILLIFLMISSAPWDPWHKDGRKDISNYRVASLLKISCYLGLFSNTDSRYLIKFAKLLFNFYVKRLI